jgi:hypothetical protein
MKCDFTRHNEGVLLRGRLAPAVWTANDSSYPMERMPHERDGQ